MTPSDLLQLNDIDFLKAIVERYPETVYLAGKAEASPEGNPLLRKDALAYQVFGKDVVIDPTAVEADRTFLGLLTLKWALTDQYEKFTSLQGNPAAKLTRESFNKLRDYSRGIASTEEALEFCLYSLACNDLGKTLFLVEKHKEVMGKAAEDHDLLLGTLIQAAPQLFPAYQGLLTAEQQESYKRGINANLNLGQFVQGENLPVSLVGMQAIDAESRGLRLVCELFDFAGVTGHVNAGGSIVMTEENYIAFSSAIEELTKEPLDQSYQRYIERRASLVGISTDTAEGFALGRVAALARAFTPAQGKVIQSAWQALSDEDRAALTKGLNATGLDGQKGVLVYYAPAVIANAVKATCDFGLGLKHALSVIAQVYAETPDEMGTGVITVNVAEQARQAAQLMGFPGKKLAFIGGGGGSDAIQASVLAVLSEKPSCVISVRTDKTLSQGFAGAIGEKRTVEKHGGEVVKGVFRIKPETTGSGRFLESIPADKVPMYLVIDAKDGRLQEQLQAAIDDFGGVDTVIDVDTGGDCLYRTGVTTDASKATPDQDLESLNAVSGLKAANLLSCVIAKGVDSPEYADEVLKAAKAQVVNFTAAQKEQILALYKDFQLDGSNPKRYGKTPFAWQAALRGERGDVKLPLPDNVVNDPKNPWNPIVNITAEMAGGYVMTVANHLNAIKPAESAPVQKQGVAPKK